MASGASKAHSVTLPPRRPWSEWVRESLAAIENGQATPPAPGRSARDDAAQGVQRGAPNDGPADHGPLLVPSPELLRRIHGSAWGEALRLTDVRRQRRAVGLDAGVRAIARSLETSAARVSDLLQIIDALTVTDVQLIGISDGPADDTWEAVEARGHARLAALSFRALRSIARLPTFRRIAEVKRLGETAAASRSIHRVRASDHSADVGHSETFTHSHQEGP